MTKAQKLRNKTYQEAKELLQEHKRCAIIRPTGFGKTGILTRLIKDYKNVLYLYPTEVIRDAVLNFYYGEDNVPENRSIPNVEFLTYQGLAIADTDKLKSYKNIDLIICDECHRLGGPLTSKAMHELLGMYPNVHACGATATPERMDLIDEISVFFDNHTTSIYTLHDAFQDGILQRPYYCFCSYDAQRTIEETEKATRLEIDKSPDAKSRENLMDLLKSNIIEISNILKMENIIRTTCDEVLDDTNYMKFIVFCRDLKHVRESKERVSNWFNVAYPDHDIRTLVISSESAECVANVAKLPEFSYADNTIDLIFCCEMMNMGYHVDNLTGIVMYRGTSSGIIYAQQLGRVLSSGNKKAGLVFDVVDNLHRESIYEVLGHESKEIQDKKQRYWTIQSHIEKYEETNDPADKPTESVMAEYKELKEFMQRYDRRVHNTLQPDDLIATSFEATYKEIIAKTVAEPISMRCRQAYAYWKERGGDDSTFTPEYVMSRQSPNAVPLSPFAKVKNVSIESVLNEIFGKGDYHELIERYCS